jgi:hypothetical protein
MNARNAINPGLTSRALTPKALFVLLRSARSEGAKMIPTLPSPRGPVSEWLLGSLFMAPHPFVAPVVSAQDAILDEDLQLSLYCCYELHYRGLPGVSDNWEWEPCLLEFRRRLEAAFEEDLRSALPDHGTISPADVPHALKEMSRGKGFSLSAWLLEHGKRFHAEEFTIHRSGYQLKEADPHTWGIPRLPAEPRPQWSRFSPMSTATGWPPTCTRRYSLTQ